MSTGTIKISVFCIDCDQPIKLDARPKVGQLITCAHCGAELEVIDVDPIELDWAYFEPEEEDEDWEGDEEDYDDDDEDVDDDDDDDD